MLKEEGVLFEYREYREDPLSATEIRKVLKMLGMKPRDVLRRNDRAFRELGLTGDENAGTLIAHLAAHPTLLQRPIGIADGRAVVGRPPEKLLELGR